MNWFSRKKNKTHADASQAHVAEEERELTENDIMDEVYWLCRPASRSVPSAKRIHYRAWGELILDLTSRLRYAEKKLAMMGFGGVTDHNYLVERLKSERKYANEMADIIDALCDALNKYRFQYPEQLVFKAREKTLELSKFPPIEKTV